jgi:formylglycine-generating enzyme required for sulfatase activity
MSVATTVFSAVAAGQTPPATNSAAACRDCAVHPADTAARTGRRVALVVGNGNYQEGGTSLVNPPNDANDVATALTSIGFEVATVVDATKRDMDAALQRFARMANSADTALFFYAGHALQFQGINYLMPVDGKLQDEISISFEMVKVDDVQSALNRAAGVRILILDACRNNPLTNRLTSARGASPRGLAPTDRTEGMVVAYATAAGDVADDGAGRNSPFTTALLKRLQEPGLEIEMMFRRVTSDVVTRTNGRQRPATYISLLSEYYLNQEDRHAWDRIDKGDAAALRDFVSRYPASPIARAAFDQLAILEHENFARRQQELRDQEERMRAAQRRSEDEQQKQTDDERLKHEEEAVRRRQENEPPPVAMTKPLQTPGPADVLEAKPGVVVQDCPDCPELVVVPAGEFLMGSANDHDAGSHAGTGNEGPQHKVLIREPIAVGRFEVTRDQFEAFVQASGYRPGDRCYTLENNQPVERAGRSFRNPGFQQTGRHPAVCVNWADAKAYVGWLTQTAGKTYRLLSEAEWEYVARAGGTLRHGFSGDAAAACRFANGADQAAKLARLPANNAYMSCSDGHPYTAPAGSYEANAFGLYDLLGNAWEWTEDCFYDDYAAAPSDGSARPAADGAAAGSCAFRTVRGGGWFSAAESLRPAVRAKAAATSRYDEIGFRVARPLTNPVSTARP